MSTIKDGGPAFPMSFEIPNPPQGEGIQEITYATVTYRGMSLRDYFAAKAVQGILAHPQCGDINPELAIYAAREAFEVADAMLAARESQP